jgi:hypothetical protein
LSRQEGISQATLHVCRTQLKAGGAVVPGDKNNADNWPAEAKKRITELERELRRIGDLFPCEGPQVKSQGQGQKENRNAPQDQPIDPQPNVPARAIGAATKLKLTASINPRSSTAERPRVTTNDRTPTLNRPGTGEQVFVRKDKLGFDRQSLDTDNARLKWQRSSVG